jgi:hypothetical protein
MVARGVTSISTARQWNFATDERAKAVDELYRLLGEVEARVGRCRPLSDCSRASGWSAAGVYFFFEDGEFRCDGTTPRVVRVDTHGLRASRSTLWAGCRNTGEPLGGASWRRKPSQLDLSTSGRRSDPQPPRRTRRGSINESAICGQRQGVVEAGAISLLSNLGSDTIDSSSPNWLGRYAYRLEIVDSRLWNVRHVRDASSTRGPRRHRRAD